MGGEVSRAAAVALLPYGPRSAKESAASHSAGPVVLTAVNAWRTLASERQGACRVTMVWRDGPDNWVVQLAAQAEPEVTVEIRMSRETAEKLAAREAARLQALNPGRDDLPPQDVGRAVMHVLSLYASNRSI